MPTGAEVKLEDQKPSENSAPTLPASSFLHALQSTAWLPSSQGGVAIPSALFYPDNHNLSLLGEHVPYLACPIKDTAFLAALGIHTEISWHDVLRMLGTWAQQPSFKSSVEQMSHIYSFLASATECEPAAAESICSAFAQSPLIWLPVKSPLADISNTTAVATPAMRTSGYVTPQLHSRQNRRKSHRKVAFMTPGSHTRQPYTDTPVPPAYTPYTVTPGWSAPVMQRQTYGSFHAASGGILRLWDSAEVLEGIPDHKLSIRILSAVYTNETVLQFFAEGLVTSVPTPALPIPQFAKLNKSRQRHAARSQHRALADFPSTARAASIAK